MFRRQILFLALFWLTGGAMVHGQVVLSDIRPFALARGQETEIRLIGDRLQDSYEVISYTPGIAVSELQVREDAKQVTAKIKIDDDFPMGWHALRLVTPRGISDLRTIYVGDLPTSMEPREPHGPSQPLDIEFPSVVTGRISVPGEIDAYSFDVEAGQQISIEIQAMRAGRAPVDAEIKLLDPQGEVIAECDDTVLTKEDPFLTIATTETGKYTVLVSESRFDGSGRHWYLMHVGSFPRPVLCDPPGAPGGQELPLRFRLPDGNWLEQVTAIPHAKDIRQGAWSLFVANEHGTAPSPLFFRISDMDSMNELEPNDALATANDVQLPVAVHGTIASEKDRDFFKFAGKKGQVLRAQVVARKPIRSALDSLLNIRLASGRSLSTNDDAGGPDSRIELTLPADDEYVVMIRGQLARLSADQLLLYRLELGPPRKGIRVTIPNPQQNVTKTVTVPSGGRSAFLLQTNRSNVAGPVNVAMSELPQGVTNSAIRLEPNVGQIPIVLEAEPDAVANSSLVRIYGTVGDKAEYGADLALRQLLTRGRNNVELCGVSMDRLAVAVTAKSPFSIELVEPKVELAPSGQMKLKVKVDREEGFAAPINVSMVYNPPGVSSPRTVTIPGDKAEGIVTLTSNNNPARGNWPIVLQASANDNRNSLSRQIETCTQLYKLEVADGYFDVTMPRVELEQGDQTEYSVRVSPKRSFEGTAKAELIGLPRGVSAQAVELTNQSEAITFQILAAADARPGTHSGLRCRLTVQKNGEPILQTLGAAKIRIDRPLPEGEEVAMQEPSRD